MNKSENIGQFAKALSLLQGEVEDPVKDSQGYGYKYAKHDQSLKKTRPLLKKYGLCVVQSPGAITQIIFKGEELLIIEVETTVMHESGEWISNVMHIPITAAKGLVLAQSCGATVTYGRRIAYLSTLGIAAEDDDLSEIAQHVREQEQKSAPLKKMNEPLLTEKQLKEINDIVGDDAPRIGKIYKYYGVSSLEKLTYQQAVQLLLQLNKPEK